MLTLATLLGAGLLAGLGVWATFRLLGRLALDPTERLALALAFYPAALGLAAFAGLLAGQPGVTLPLAMTLLLFLLVWWAGAPGPAAHLLGPARLIGRPDRHRMQSDRTGACSAHARGERVPPPSPDPTFRAALQALALFGLATLGTVLATPVSGGALRIGDWVAHWFLVLVYLGQPLPDLRVFVNRVGDFGVVSRPPLYNLEGGLLVGPLDVQFWSFQLGGALVGVPIVVAAVLWARNVGGVAAARAIVPLCALSPFLIQNTAYPWPKMVAALLVLLFLHFVRAAALARDPSRRRQAFLLAAASAGLAYLAHQTAVFYVAPTFLWLAWRRPRPLFAGPARRTLLTCGLAGLVGVAVVAPWQLWVITTYGLRATVEANPAWFGADETETVGAWVLKGGVATLGTLVPLPVLEALTRGVAPSVDQLLRIQLALLTGALGLSGIAVLARAACRGARSAELLAPLRRPPWLALVALGGFAGQVTLQPNWHTTGDAAESMTPIVVLGLAYVARELGTLGPTARRLFCAAVVAEVLLFSGLYLWWAFGSAWTRDPNTVLATRYGLTHVRSLSPLFGPLGAVLLAVASGAATVMLWRIPGRRRSAAASPRPQSPAPMP